MRSLLILVLILGQTLAIWAQSIPSYYNGVNFSLSGLALKAELAQKITSTHTTNITYSQVWNVLKSGDINPNDGSEVLLLYGWDDSDGDGTNDLTRDKDNNGGNNGQWNREHTYPKSLGTPDLGTSGPGADAHNLRACDVQRNGSRGNKKFAAGSGTASGTVGANWYPGDDWRGDVARILMYMYLRYNNQCKPSGACVGNPNAVDLNMVNLLLEWNAIDPVSNMESYRNEIIQQYQGNRNPFIDNPYLATKIWGGTTAENTWNLSLTTTVAPITVQLYPNPVSSAATLHIYSEQAQEVTGIQLFQTNGALIQTTPQTTEGNTWQFTNLPEGLILVRIQTVDGILTRKIVVN